MTRKRATKPPQERPSDVVAVALVEGVDEVAREVAVSLLGGDDEADWEPVSDEKNGRVNGTIIFQVQKINGAYAISVKPEAKVNAAIILAIMNQLSEQLRVDLAVEELARRANLMDRRVQVPKGPTKIGGGVIGPDGKRIL